MPKEAETRKKIVQILNKEKFLCWYPARVKYKQNDIFGIFDLICWQKRKSTLKFIQLTTLSNLSTRIKKIKNFLKKNKLSKRAPAKIEVWGWNKRNKGFKIVKIN